MNYTQIKPKTFDWRANKKNTRPHIQTTQILTKVARRDVAQSLLQALGLLAETRRTRIVVAAVERILGQLKVIRLDAVHLAGVIVANRQSATKRFAVQPELFVFRYVLREDGAVVGAAQRVAYGVSVGWEGMFDVIRLPFS